MITDSNSEATVCSAACTTMAGCESFLVKALAVVSPIQNAIQLFGYWL